MNLRNQPSGLFSLAVSILVCALSMGVKIGTFQIPGPGFLPFWSGVFLGTFSIVLIVKSFLRKKDEGEIIDLWKGVEWIKAVLVLASLFAYAILLTKVGYLITTFGLMAFLFGLIEKTKLWIRVMSAFVAALVTYIIFHVWLDVQLPKGIFGF